MAGPHPHKPEIMAAWNAYEDSCKAKGEQPNMSDWCKSHGLPYTFSLGSLRQWLGLNKERPLASSTATTPNPTRKASSKTGANLLAEFEAQERDARDKRLLSFLEDAVKDLEAQLAAAQSELRRHKESMGLIQPSVEE